MTNESLPHIFVQKLSQFVEKLKSYVFCASVRYKHKLDLFRRLVRRTEESTQELLLYSLSFLEAFLANERSGHVLINKQT